MHTHDGAELLQEAIKVFMWNEQACLHTEMSFSQHNINIRKCERLIEKQADTGKHITFKKEHLSKSALQKPNTKPQRPQQARIQIPI